MPFAESQFIQVNFTLQLRTSDCHDLVRCQWPSAVATVRVMRQFFAFPRLCVFVTLGIDLRWRLAEPTIYVFTGDPMVRAVVHALRRESITCNRPT